MNLRGVTRLQIEDFLLAKNTTRLSTKMFLFFIKINFRLYLRVMFLLCNYEFNDIRKFGNFMNFIYVLVCFCWKRNQYF